MLLWVSDELTVDKAIENIGFGWFQAKLTVIIGLGWVCIIFTARRFASAAYAVVGCLSMRPSSRCCVETNGRIELVLARRLPSTVL